MRIETSYQLKCVALGLCCLALGACGGASTPGTSDGAVAPGAFAAGLAQAPAFAGAGLPAPSELSLRAASGTYVIDPAAPLSCSPEITPDDPLIVTAPLMEYRYAIYACSPVNAISLPEQLVFNLDGSFGQVWLGLANFTAERWE